MPAVFFFLVALFLILALGLGAVFYFRKYLQKTKASYASRITLLERQLAEANARVSEEAVKTKAVKESSAYDKNAGVILNQLDRGVVVISADKTIQFMNPYAKRFVDLSAETGMSYQGVVRASNYDVFEAGFLGRTQQLSEGATLTSQRGTIPVSGTVTPFDGGILFLFQDKTTEIARVKEEQAFFSAAAHELRTPLTIIRMTVSLLREKFDTMPKEKIIEHLKRTDETTERLVRLVNEFLNVSRIDQGRLEIQTEKFDVVTLTEEVIGNLSMLAKERNLYIHHDVEITERSVVADRSKSSEVLSNLISNALKYTIRGGVTVSHSVSTTVLTTTVTDTGSGIDRAAQGMLFKRFGQVGSSAQHVASKSTGLGLYISKKFAQLMRGDVVLVKSEPGTGSTFAFTLPLR